MTEHVAYLGPPGSFCEVAAKQLTSDNTILQPYSTVHLAMHAVHKQAAKAAVLPLENSLEGSVNVTLDELIHGDPVMIRAEAGVHINFALLTHPETALQEIRRIVTHPVAEAQCRNWVAQYLPDATFFSGPSTGAAARLVADRTPGADGFPYDAAIGSTTAADLYKLNIAAHNISDASAVTRFIYITPPGTPEPATGNDTTTLVVCIRHDHAGTLREVLEQFTVRGINLTRIESRPTKNGLGQYCFAIDIEGHINDERVGEAMMGLHRACADVKYLGSYPRETGKQSPLAEGTSNEDFNEAFHWLKRLRS